MAKSSLNLSEWRIYMNFIFIAGHLGADPETRFTPSGQKVVSLRIAVNVRKGGKEETVWYRVTIWGDRFDKMMPYLKKGSGVIVSGELGKPEIYNDREGKPQIALEITAENIRFSPFGRGEKGKEEGAQGTSRTFTTPDSYSYTTSSSTGQGAYVEDDQDDALPF
ncbi:Single-stranded DNA-binding protein [Chlamydiales bacterium STE3]|nr:Single-stranded DNA-binding protein [Chlamydiales bacterium STE3]